MSQEFKNWLQDAGVEWDSLNSDKRVQYKVSFDKLKDATPTWILNTNPIQVLGDDESGPHSTAVVVGRKTVIACAHSLGLVIDDSKRKKKGKNYFKYLENYWIQTRFTKDTRGNYTKENQIKIRLLKFHIENDWAVFTRDDGIFSESEIAVIDESPITNPNVVLIHQRAAVLHCPVSLKSEIFRAAEFTIGCNISAVQIQGQSTHHLKYEGRDVVKGSSGGGVYVYPSTAILGIHLESINCAEFDADESSQIISHTSKRVSSEEQPYEAISTEAPTKRLKTESETIASISGGTNGLGSALIICRHPRLMHYIRENEANA